MIRIRKNRPRSESTFIGLMRYAFDRFDVVEYSFTISKTTFYRVFFLKRPVFVLRPLTKYGFME